ncbi:MAG: alpha/beta fold hydrolase [Halobacteriovoraceae bacterium]|nr:alpha/beta fold hydrolase [Halobacteriovoraceae bacterium]
MYIQKFQNDVDSQTKKAILFLHGFPAESSISPVDPKIEKNIDIAENFAQTFKLDTYLLHYKGLGKSEGIFSFTGSIEDSLKYCESLTEKGYEQIYLFGHSWGGLVALNLAHKLTTNIAGLALFSPFNLIGSRPEIESLFDLVVLEVPYLFEKKTKAEYIDELIDIGLFFSPRKFANEILSDIPIYIYQAINDNEVPEQTTLDLVNLLHQNCFYKEIKTDHSLKENRDKVVNLILNDLISKKFV